MGLIPPKGSVFCFTLSQRASLRPVLVPPAAALQNHDQCTGPDQNAPDQGFCGELLMQKHKRQHQRDNDAQLVDRDNL